MSRVENDNSLAIIGAGFAGLGAGIYARMNGYRTEIFEMHDKPGGLCTSWKRKGYTFDGCIHWLVGSNPESSMYQFWEEAGIAQGRKIINMDEYMRFESNDGRTVIFYCDVDRLERHLLEVSPSDREAIREFTCGIRMCLSFDAPAGNAPFLKRLYGLIRLGLNFAVNGRKFSKYMKITAEEFSSHFRDPLLKAALKEMWMPEFSILFMFFTFAYLHKKNAGYPLGGSTPMSEALEKRYLSLGGKINYRKKVEKILVENDKAVGIRLTDGTEYRAGRVISAADGYSTIFNMLDGKYADDKTREPYEKWQIFQPLIFAGFGVNRSFKDEPVSVSGFSYPLAEPVEIGGMLRDRLWIHLYNHDASMAPGGKTSIIIMLESRYDYWEKLARDETAYRAKKEEIARILINHLDKRFPGIASQVEVVDIATPMTFKRYTGNWQGSFEGWLITPENAYTMMKPMSNMLPGLSNFYMSGQWVQPGGGLPTGIMSGRRLIKSICKEDKRKFRTTKG
ncbi:MAG: NAD(P)/FAD-dependent oxidoreductase [Bacteroidota bacterium]